MMHKQINSIGLEQLFLFSFTFSKARSNHTIKQVTYILTSYWLGSIIYLFGN